MTGVNRHLSPGAHRPTIQSAKPPSRGGAGEKRGRGASGSSASHEDSITASAAARRALRLGGDAVVEFTCDLELAGPYGTRKTVAYPRAPATSFYAVSNASGTRGQKPSYIIAPTGLTGGSYCLTVRARVVCTDAHLREASYADRPHLRHLGLKDGTAALYQTLDVLDASGSIPSLRVTAQAFCATSKPAPYTPLHDCYMGLGGAETGGIRNHVEQSPGIPGFGPRWKVTHVGALRFIDGLRQAAFEAEEGQSAFRVLDVSRIAGAVMPKPSAHVWAVTKFTSSLAKNGVHTPQGQALNEFRLAHGVVEKACAIMPDVSTRSAGVARSAKTSREEEDGFINQVIHDSRVASLLPREVDLLSVYPLETVMALDINQRAALLAVRDVCPIILASPRTVASMCMGRIHFRPFLLAKLSGPPVHRLARDSGELAMASFLEAVDRDHARGRRLTYSDQAGIAGTARALVELGLIRTCVDGVWPHCTRLAELACASANYAAATTWVTSIIDAVGGPSVRTQAYDPAGVPTGMVAAAAKHAASGGLVVTAREGYCHDIFEELERMTNVGDLADLVPSAVFYYGTQARRFGELNSEYGLRWARHLMESCHVEGPITRVMLMGADHLDDSAFIEAVGVIEVFLRAVDTSFSRLSDVEFAVSSSFVNGVVTDAGDRPPIVTTEASPRGCFPKVQPPVQSLTSIPTPSISTLPWGTVPSAAWTAFLTVAPQDLAAATCPPLFSSSVTEGSYVTGASPMPDLVLYTGHPLDSRASMDMARRCNVAEAGRSAIYVADTCEFLHLVQSCNTTDKDGITQATPPSSVALKPEGGPTIHSQPRACCTSEARHDARPYETLDLTRHDVRFGLVHSVREYRGPRVNHVIALVMPGAVHEDLLAICNSAVNVTMIVMVPGPADVDQMTVALSLIGELVRW